MRRLLLSFLLVACVEDPNDDDITEQNVRTKELGAQNCRESVSGNHVRGIGGSDLVGGINENSARPVGKEEGTAKVVEDRFRLKPVSSLETEFVRVLGKQQEMIDVLRGSTDTFGKPPARWYAEPQAGATTLYTIYRAAFKGCLQYADTYVPYQSQPTLASAKLECSVMMRKAWSRTPTPDQVNACAFVATDEAAFAAAKPYPVTDPKFKWAYACAAILDSSPFLAY